MANDETVSNNIESSEEAEQEIPKQISELTEVDMLSAKVVELENNVNQFKDQLLRKAAEFENYKRRVENDLTTIVKFANEELIIKFLPVLDDFERSMKVSKVAEEGDNRASALEQSRQDPTAEANFRRGMQLIYNKLKKILELQGVKQIDVVGKPFDPQYHDALLHVHRKDVPPHTVIEEIDKGYVLNDKVIRHAKVIVAADEGAREETPGKANTNFHNDSH